MRSGDLTNTLRMFERSATCICSKDEFDARQIAHHAILKLADNPSQPGLRPRGLQGMNQRHNVGDIADRRRAQNAKGLWRDSGFGGFSVPHAAANS